MVSSQLSGALLCYSYLKWLHRAKCATPGKVLESGVLAAFPSVQLGSHGEVDSFQTQPDQAPGCTSCRFHSPPVLENVSSAACSAGSCHPSASHISFTNVIPLSLACLRSGCRVAVSQKHQAVVASDGPWFLGFCLRAPFMLFERAQQVFTQKSPPVAKSLPLWAPHSRTGSDLHCKYAHN